MKRTNVEDAVLEYDKVYYNCYVGAYFYNEFNEGTLNILTLLEAWRGGAGTCNVIDIENEGTDIYIIIEPCDYKKVINRLKVLDSKG